MYKTSKNSQILYYDHAKYLNDLRQLLNIYIYIVYVSYRKIYHRFFPQFVFINQSINICAYVN